mgnify:CR=1 FL=1
MKLSEKFKKWGLEYSGCDGGDIGNDSSPSIWVCGIEWGGGHTAESLREHIMEDATVPPKGYLEWKENLQHRFNWQVMKILSVINGGLVSEYKKFAEDVQPFIRGKNGYFKMNLYPIAFKNTSHEHWNNNFADITGFQNKTDYLSWCSECRFPEMRKWAKQSAPKLIICLGKTYINEFKLAFYKKDAQFNHKEIDNRDLYWAINEEGTLIIVIPFMSGRYGLVKNVSIQKFGENISHLLTTR